MTNSPRGTVMFNITRGTVSPTRCSFVQLVTHIQLEQRIFELSERLKHERFFSVETIQKGSNNSREEMKQSKKDFGFVLISRSSP